MYQSLRTQHHGRCHLLSLARDPTSDGGCPRQPPPLLAPCMTLQLCLGYDHALYGSGRLTGCLEEPLPLCDPVGLETSKRPPPFPRALDHGSRYLPPPQLTPHAPHHGPSCLGGQKAQDRRVAHHHMEPPPCSPRGCLHRQIHCGNPPWGWGGGGARKTWSQPSPSPLPTAWRPREGWGMVHNTCASKGLPRRTDLNKILIMGNNVVSVRPAPKLNRQPTLFSKLPRRLGFWHGSPR